MGSDSSIFGFTNEYTNEYTSQGLIYLRSRTYDPSIGRFLSKDSWSGGETVPMSYNAWLYVDANPVNYTDPSGRFVEQDESSADKFQRADLTIWFVNEMNADRQSWVIQFIKSNLGTAATCVYNQGNILAAYLAFYNVVRTGGQWDFKEKIEAIVGDNIRMSGKWYFNDVPGNISFGYLGTAAGFDSNTLHCGADFANNGIPCSHTDPSQDFNGIEAGIQLFNISSGANITENSLKSVLDEYNNKLHRGVPYVPRPAANNYTWPYPVGTFDGNG